MSGCKSGHNEPIISEPECFGDFVGITLRNHHYNLPRCKCKNSRFFESVSNICSFQNFTVLAIHSDLLGWLSDPSERFFVKTLLGYQKVTLNHPGVKLLAVHFLEDSLQCRILWATVQVAETLAIAIKQKKRCSPVKIKSSYGLLNSGHFVSKNMCSSKFLLSCYGKNGGNPGLPKMCLSFKTNLLPPPKKNWWESLRNPSEYKLHLFPCIRG